MDDGKVHKEPWWLLKFSQSSIPAKGLFLVLVPVFVQILFLAVFWLIQTNVEKDRLRAFHSKNVLLASLRAQSNFTVSFNRALLFVLDKNNIPVSEVDSRLEIVESDVEQIISAVSDSPSQTAKIQTISAEFKEFKSFLTDLIQRAETLSAPGSEQRGEEVETLSSMLSRLGARSKQIRDRFDEFIETEKTFDDKRQAAFQKSLNSLFWLFVVGTATMIGGAFSLHKFFSETFSKRVESVIRNVKSVSQGQELEGTLPGTDEISEIDAAIHMLGHVLREKDAETELFVYSVSHDLRSPLVNLHGFSEELAITIGEIQKALKNGESNNQVPFNQINRLIDNDLKESLRYIKSAVERMATIIDSLLQLSRVGRNEYRMENLELKTVLTAVTDSLSSTAAEKGASISVGPLPEVLGDRGALEQVFQNLLQNALKYSDPTRPPVVEIGELGRTSEYSTIFVKDNGLGIPETSMHKLFVAFRRFHPNIAPGEGIGLAIARQMVLRHKGRIWCESKTGIGSTFYVSLPLQVRT